MPYESSPELLVLHAVRLKGMASDNAVARRFALDRAETAELLLDFEAYGWIRRAEFGGLEGSRPVTRWRPTTRPTGSGTSGC